MAIPEPFNYDQLDAGIRDTVRMLHEHGWATSDSGDGWSKPKDERSILWPHVVCPVPDPSIMVTLAHRLADLLGADWHVEASYSTENKVALLVAMKNRLEGCDCGQDGIPDLGYHADDCAVKLSAKTQRNSDQCPDTDA